MIIDYFLVYQFVKRLATPFSEWDAFKLGIIDADGNILKKRKDLLTIPERNAFGLYDLLLLNIKKLLAKIPGGSSKLASYAAALYLIREYNEFTDETILTESHIFEFNETEFEDFISVILEDIATNNVGTGNIAGAGVGPDGEPGIRKYRKNPRKTLRDLLGVAEDLEVNADVAHVKQKRYKKHIKPSIPSIIPSERIT
jgi:hypothetical protein